MVQQKSKIRNIPKELHLLSIPLKNKNLEHFVTAKSMTLLRMMELSHGFLAVDLHGFLAVDPDLWKDRDDFRQAKETLKSLMVVNDHAERGVALLQEYSGLLTRDESQLQFSLQVVEVHRWMYPDSRKQTMSGVPHNQ
jgi:hypothetical protein